MMQKVESCFKFTRFKRQGKTALHHCSETTTQVVGHVTQSLHFGFEISTFEIWVSVNAVNINSTTVKRTTQDVGKLIIDIALTFS